ncbi:MAG: hypothetical protein V1836_01160 [Candidatus Aenigmatarchaeota archaeon]
MGMWDRLFWLWFVLSGISVAFVVYANPSLSAKSGLLIGASIIATGIVKLADEVTFKELKCVNEKILETLHWIKEGLNKLGTNVPMEDDEQHKMLAKKILELENRVNRVSRALTEEIVEIKTKQSDDYLEITEKDEQKTVKTHI